MQFSHTEIIVLMLFFFFLLSFVLPECEERLLKLLLTTLLLPSFLPSVNHKRTGWLVDTHYTLTQSARLLALRHFRDFPNGTHDTQREIRCFPDFFFFFPLFSSLLSTLFHPFFRDSLTLSVSRICRWVHCHVESWGNCWISFDFSTFYFCWLNFLSTHKQQRFFSHSQDERDARLYSEISTDLIWVSIATVAGCWVCDEMGRKKASNWKSFPVV